MPDEKALETSGLNNLLSGILSNPELIKTLTSPTESSEKTDGNTAPTSPTDGLSALLTNPALLEKLPQMIAVMKPLLGNLPTSTGDGAQAASKSASPQCARDTLLLSLKPFLSPRRCEAIDTMLRINRLGSVLGQLK